MTDYTYTWSSAEQISLVRTASDGTSVCVPTDPVNRDYAEFLSSGAVAKLPSEAPVTWDTIRSQRDQLIRDTDWTMIPGATVDQAQWASYRQILRDLPQTYTNPEDVVWPVQPSTTGPNTAPVE
jgi:hypothetical protein